MRKDQWFPARESANVVGRFVDLEQVDVKASKEAGANVYRLITALEAKVAGSNDISAQAVKPMNEKELISRFPAAWEHYRAIKSAALATPDIPEDEIKVAAAPIKGTPLHKSDFIPRARMAWLADQGFATIEQIRDMSDTQVGNLGRGALAWRRKAKEFLERT